MNVFWIFLIDVVLLTRISAASYMSKCVMVAAGSIAISFADLNLYVEDDTHMVNSESHEFSHVAEQISEISQEEDHYFFIKKQEPKPERPKEDEVTRLTRFHKECINETKVQPDLVQKLSKGNWELNFPALKEWAFCVLNKMELMSKQGVYRLDVAFSRIPSNLKKTAENIIDKCLSSTAIPPVQIAWKYLSCLGNVDSKGEFSKLGIFYNISSDIK